MAPAPAARYQVGLALTHDRVAVLVDAECFALAQAHQLVIACLLREGVWPVVVVIVRRDDGMVLDRLRVAAAHNA
jgi:hypothetical protein